MSLRTIVAVVAAVALAGPVVAGERRDQTERRTATEHWLELQRSGGQSTAPKPIGGEVASRIYRRYLESFSRPIPDTFYETREFSSD